MGVGEVAFQLALFIFSVIVTTATNMLTPLSKNSHGGYDYVPATAVFLAEILKLSISACLLLGDAVMRRSYPDEAELYDNLNQQNPVIPVDPLTQLSLYIIPALFWFIGNNLTFLALQGISPAANQVIGQSKVIFTVVLLAVLLNRRFSNVQLLSLGILAAALISMVDEDSSSLHKGDRVAHVMSGPNSTTSTEVTESQYPLSPLLGVVFSITTSFLGSLAGVYNEKLLKQQKSSINFQNICAYVWGMAFNLVLVFISQSSREKVALNGFLGGYNRFVWFYILSVAMMGLSVSFVFKFLDNIARTFTLGTSTALTVFLSWPAFGHQPTISEGCCVVTIFLALLLYYTAEPAQPPSSAGLVSDEQPTVPGAAKESTGLLDGKVPLPTYTAEPAAAPRSVGLSDEQPTVAGAAKEGTGLLDGKVALPT